MQSELKPCAHETQCAKHTDTSRSDHPVKRMLDFATNRVETQAAEITRLTEALRAAEEQSRGFRDLLVRAYVLCDGDDGDAVAFRNETRAALKGQFNDA